MIFSNLQLKKLMLIHCFLAAVKEVVEEVVAEQEKPFLNIVNQKFFDSNHDTKDVYVHLTTGENSVKLGMNVNVNYVKKAFNDCTDNATEMDQ